MRDLEALQRTIWAALAGGDGANLDELVPAVQDDARATAATRLGLYASMYRQRLHEALASDFPRLSAVRGEGGFHALVTAYLAAHPSTHPSLRHLGRALPQYLRATDGAGWHAELASLEWARLDVHDRADEQVLTLASLCASAARGFADLRLRAIAAHALVRVTHDVTSVWRQQEGERVPPLPHHRVVVVWRRPDHSVHHRLASQREAERLVALREGIDFAALCADLRPSCSDEHAARQALELVGGWTADGLLAACP